MKKKTSVNVGEVESSKWTLNGKDVKKILKGAGLSFGAAVLFSVASWLGSGSVDWKLFGTVCIPAALSTGINAFLKFWAGEMQ